MNKWLATVLFLIIFYLCAEESNHPIFEIYSISTMIAYNETEIPVLRGEAEGRSAQVLSETDLRNVKMNDTFTVLKKGAIVEFLDRLIVKQQKRRATDPDNAPKNMFILMNVDGKHRWIGLGTFTRRNFNTANRDFISPISKDIPENMPVSAFYNQFKNKKFRVIDRISIQTDVFDANGNITGEKTLTEYPVLDYYNQ